jgi:DNA primase
VEIIKKFELGYNPESRDSFAKAATASQFNKELLQKAGLVVQRENGLQDNYRGRIIFPIHNQTGKIAGFGARLIRNNDKAPKYINTPENEIYVKSKILYGSYFARQAIDKANECLLVEGYTDVLALHQAGIENVVASGGTSLTPDQLRLIKKYTQNLTILYDGDNAGIKAALRGLDLALEEGLDVKLALLPNQEDPDSYINKYGVASFTSFIRENKKDFILFQLEHLMQEAGEDTNKRSRAINLVAETISRINKAEDFSKQQDYIHKTAEFLKVDETGLHALVNKYIREKLSKDEKRFLNSERIFQEPGLEMGELSGADTDALELLSKDELNERAVVRCLLEFGLKEWEPGQTVAEYLLDEWLDEKLITNAPLLKIVNIYATWYKQKLEPTPKNFLYSDDLEMSRVVVSLIEFPYEISANWLNIYEVPVPTREDNFKQEIVSTLNYLELKKIRKLISVNQKELESSTSPERQILLLQTHVKLKDLENQITKEIGAVILK